MPRNTLEPIVQFRGSKTAMDKYAGPEGEITVDVTTKTVIVQDGVTKGGSPLVTTKTAQTISGEKTFSTSPLVPTPAVNDSSKAVATTEFVAKALANAGVGSGQVGQMTIGGIGNAVLAGRKKRGYPKYLVAAELIDEMERETAVYNNGNGVVESSSEYSTSYRATAPLRNMKSYNGGYWATANGVTGAWWQYDFKDRAHVICGMYINLLDNDYSRAFKKWSVLGWNEEEEEWDVLFSRNNDQPLRGTGSNLKARGRTYWFTSNTKAYKRIRLQVDSINGGPHLQVAALKFYENVVPGQHQNDLVVYGSQEEPLIGNLVLGRADASSDFESVNFKLTAPVTYNGRKLTELSKNWMYVTKEDRESKHFADKSVGNRYIPLGGTGLFVGADTRKIHYGTERDIELQTTALLTCSDMREEGPTSELRGMPGLLNYAVTWTNVNIQRDVKHRGGNFAMFFPGTNNRIVTATSMHDTFPDKMKRPYCREFTVEMDVKWTGFTPTNDDWYTMFDNGYGGGFAITYHARRRCIALVFKDTFGRYSVPFDLSDNKWHSIAVSGQGNNLYMHVDGKCLGAFDDVPLWRPSARGWCIGSNYNSNSRNWHGWIDNFRLVNGTCLYQGEDYVVPDYVPTAIPDGTLLHDRDLDVVKEYDAETHTWSISPRLCLGYVNTGRRENLMTNQPLGTFHTRELEGVIPSGYNKSGEYNTDNGATCLFNFGHGMEYGYLTPGNANTTDHWVEFTLEQASEFERLFLCAHADSYARFPHKFLLYGIDDSGNKTLLFQSINRDYMEGNDLVFVSAGSQDPDGHVATHTEQGTPACGVKSINGNTHNLTGYRILDILSTAKGNKFKKFRIELPKKAGTPYFKDESYTRVIIMPFYAGGKSEILDCVSNVIGDTFSIGPVPVWQSYMEFEIPLPFGSMPFDWRGAIVMSDSQTDYVRELGQQNGWYANGHAVTGEQVFKKEGALLVQTNNNGFGLYSGNTYDLAQVASATGQADVYIVAKRSI